MNVKKTISKNSQITKQKFISDYDLHLFASGTHYKIFEKLGAHITEIDGVNGVNFAVWAPNAETVCVIGDFNRWQTGRHEMKKLNDGGVWSVFVPGLGEDMLYKYAIKPYGSYTYIQKTDPYAFRAELRPKTASVTANIEKYKWNDKKCQSMKYTSAHGKKIMTIRISRVNGALRTTASMLMK